MRYELILFLKCIIYEKPPVSVEGFKVKVPFLNFFFRIRIEIMHFGHIFSMATFLKKKIREKFCKTI